MTMTNADPHPWYGSCDAFAENGECSVCRDRVADPFATGLIKSVWESARSGTPMPQIAVDPKIVSRADMLELIDILDKLHRAYGGAGIILDTVTSSILDGRARVTVRA